MSFRTRSALLLLAAAAACGEHTAGAKPAASASSSSTTSRDSAAGAVATSEAPSAARAGSLPPNHTGRIPILEIHQIGDYEAAWTIKRDHFRHILQSLYDDGYRPVTVRQVVDKDFSDVPAGMSPVVFSLDDANPSQFSYVEQNGKLTIDPNSVVGIWEDFHAKHPDWKNRATFCMLNGGAAGHNFFGDNPKFGGQQKAWRFPKVKWLADNGFELCDHTLWHAQLNKYPDAFVQQQIAQNLAGIDSAVPGYKVTTMALPQGLWPKNKPLAWQGSWTDPKSGKTWSYHFAAVLEVSGGPARSPYDAAFDPHHLPRVIVVNQDLEKTIAQLDASKSRFVK